jgi:hypothetical protein
MPTGSRSTSPVSCLEPAGGRLYPRQWRPARGGGAIAFALWATCGLAVQSIRDHL